MSTIINARSPYFHKIVNNLANQGYSLSGVQSELYIWSGLLSAQPLTPTYTITKAPIGSDEFINLELSVLVRDFLDTEYYNVTEGIGGTADDAVWVQVNSTLFDGGSIIVQKGSRFLAFDGYGYWDEGVNPRTSTDPLVVPTGDFTPMVLMDNRTVYFKRGEDIRIPIFSEPEGQAVTTISAVWDLTDVYWAQSNINWDASSIPQNVIDSDDTADKIQYLIIDSAQALTGDTITITSTVGELQEVVITLQEIDCGKYDDYRVIFYNKYGALQDFYMSKKSSKELSIKSEDYNRNIFNRELNSYNPLKHQKYTFNIRANQSITLNSEFLPENFNKLVEQLFISEQVWISLVLKVQPVVVGSKKLKYKTNINDKLIQYTVDFDFSNSYINNVI
tara:strand:+ start:1318 stop:2490 length:1173 start_codon:yes stop_codon:yes gene_type:complete